MLREIELGPIRPPSEAGSLLLRVTRNCSWNKCRFCTLYKGERFGTRPVEEIKADIDQLVLYRDNGILNWPAAGTGAVFLQDANTLVLAADKLREILVYLREKLPEVKRVTSYGRVDALAKLSVEHLKSLKEAGLDRIHSGYESGSDKVLALINKGFAKAQEIEAGQKVKASGIEFSVYYMPGVGGKELSDDNALETADVINQIDPDFVRIRTFVPHPGTGIMDDIEAGLISECSDREKAWELKKMIEHIEGASGHLYSDHIINLFGEINGNMTADKEKMLSVFDTFEKLDARDQRRYQLARRLGWVSSLSHLANLGDGELQKLDEYLSRLKSEEELDAFMLRRLQRYI